MTAYTSSVNPALPAMDAPISSSPVRENFAATANDINFIYSLIAGLPAAQGTVTSVSGVNTNGITWSVANPTTAATITISLGAITPSSVNGITFSGSSSPSLAVTGASSISGSNTGDQVNITGNAGTVTTINSHITAGTNVTVTGSGTTASPYNISSSTAPISSLPFGEITSGTNTAQTLVIGTGSALSASGNGTITATTNANSTGVITSVGNVTSTGSQTGTGSTFVMNQSPTINEPVIIDGNLGTPSQITLTNANGIAPSLTAGNVSTINGLISAGSNVAITGSGTQASPYSISSSAGGSGTVTDINTGTGLTGGPITSSGTVSIANNTANTLAGFNNSGAFSDVAIGTNLTLSGGTLNASGGSGTVSSVSVVTANGISGSVATATTTPAITLTLGAIVPTSVNSIVLSGVSTPTLAVTGTTSVSGSNTGDQTTISGNAGTATALQTGRAINGVTFDGTADITVTAAAGTLTGSTLASGVTSSSLTSFGAAIALGTPASGIATNLTGTATALNIGGNAATVTTNANLTGPITSVGNATAIASQTGTGSTFAMSASPTFTGTINNAGEIITSTSATALTVGANGATNPALQVDASTASSATGISVKSAAAGSGMAILTISTNTNEGLTISSKGSGSIVLNSPTSGNIAFQGASNTRYIIGNSGSSHTFSTAPFGNASTARFSFTGAADTAITASTEAQSTYFNIGQTRQHLTGTLALQRDFRITGSTHSFVGASTATDIAALAIDGFGQAGTNATITNAHGILIQAQAVAGTVGTASAITVNAPTGATTNYALNVATGNIFVGTAGNGLIIKSGSNARIGTGTLTGGTVTIANTSVTANTRVFLQDTSSSITNVGTLTVVTTAGTGFVVTSTIALDASTFNWLLVESA